MIDLLPRRRAGVLFLASFVMLAVFPAEEARSQSAKDAPARDFSGYWYAGEAELNRYELQQSRYGEVREGDAVMIFVTEDFLPETQVKYEGRPAPDSPVSVLKLNATRKFLTGIYPYSTMTSVFTPVNPDEAGTYKVTTTSQEWCGHVFMQLNRRDEGYKGAYFSYFQGEGDRAFELPDVVLEDEIWTRIRLRPEALPTGEISALPGTLYLRLMHKDLGPYEATATLDDHSDDSLSDKPLKRYRLEYADLNRTLEIVFEAEFPHAILAWEETTGPLGGHGGEQTTRAVRTHAIKLDYWNYNALDDTKLRDRLGLD